MKIICEETVTVYSEMKNLFGKLGGGDQKDQDRTLDPPVYET